MSASARYTQCTHVESHAYVLEPYLHTYRGEDEPGPPPPNPSSMNLRILPTDVADAVGAKCLDGTPPALYYRAANTTADSSAATKFVIYFKGGG